MVSTARALLTHGAAIDAVCFASRTPLHEACHAANLNIVRLLCEEGASVNALEGEGFEFWGARSSVDAVVVLSCNLACAAARTGVRM